MTFDEGRKKCRTLCFVCNEEACPKMKDGEWRNKLTTHKEVVSNTSTPTFWEYAKLRIPSLIGIGIALYALCVMIIPDQCGKFVSNCTLYERYIIAIVCVIASCGIAILTNIKDKKRRI